MPRQSNRVHQQRVPESTELLKVIEKTAPFARAIESPLGKELLKDLAYELQGLFVSISNLRATDEDKMRYSIVVELMSRWMERIERYNNAVKDINSGKEEKR